MLVKPPRRSPRPSASRWPGLGLEWGGRFLQSGVPMPGFTLPGLTLPGLAALLSALAVWLGAPAPAPEVPPRLTAGNPAPALPELRPAPQSAPGVPLPAAPPPEVPWLRRDGQDTLRPESGWTAPTFAPDLATLGRWQLEG